MESAEIVNLVKILKPRSGKSVKCLVKEIVVVANLMCLVLLSNEEVKFAVLMTNREKENFNIEPEKVFLVRNITFLETKLEIPAFTIEKSSSFRNSLVKIEDTKNFNDDERTALMSVNVDNIQASSQTSSSSQSQEELAQQMNSGSQKSLLSLKEFLELPPEKVKKKPICGGEKKMFLFNTILVISLLFLGLSWLEYVLHLLQATIKSS